MDRDYSLHGKTFYEQQLMVMRGIFNSYDQNHNGSISVHEFIDMVGGMGMKFSKRDLMKVFTKCDTNGSGTITFNEFVQFFLTAPKKTRESVQAERMYEVFKVVDADHDGILNTSQCAEAMRMLGTWVDEKHVEEIMKLVDKNHDGKITLDEFVRFMEISKDTDRPVSQAIDRSSKSQLYVIFE